MRRCCVLLVPLALTACQGSGEPGDGPPPSADERQALADAEAMIVENEARIEAQADPAPEGAAGRPDRPTE